MENNNRDSSDLEKEEMIMKMQERISAPLQWFAPESCQILDLKEQHYDEVLRLIKHHFFREDPMCVSVRLLEDLFSTRSYLEKIRVWIRDTTSLVAVSSKTGRVIGTAITRINNTADRSIVYSRMEILQGEVLEKLINFKDSLVKQADAHNKLNAFEIFRVYILCVHPSHRSKGLETALLEACIEMAITMEISAVAGMFTSSASQELAATLGFRPLSEIHYGRWVVNNEVVFNNSGIGNYSAAFMGMSTQTSENLDNVRKERILKIREERARRRRRRH